MISQSCKWNTLSVGVQLWCLLLLLRKKKENEVCLLKKLQVIYILYNVQWPELLILSLQIPANSAGLIEYRAHPFWLQKYCPSHEHDGTPRCCSCERMEVSYISFQNISSCYSQLGATDGSHPLFCFCHFLWSDMKLSNQCSQGIQNIFCSMMVESYV